MSRGRMDNWSKVHFSDESKFNLFGLDDHQYIRRKQMRDFFDMCQEVLLDSDEEASWLGAHSLQPEWGLSYV